MSRPTAIWFVGSVTYAYPDYTGLIANLTHSPCGVWVNLDDYPSLWVAYLAIPIFYQGSQGGIANNYP